MKIKVAFCHFCEIHGPSVIFATKTFRNDHFADFADVESKLDEKDDCEGCSLTVRSLNISFNGFVCEDTASDEKLISVPLNGLLDDEESHLIKHACVRSLSCEVYPEGREGFIYFGDDRRGHVLSHTFVLKDSKARGFQRIYSILVIADEKQALLSQWDFFLYHIQRIIKKLKDRASSVYDEELSQTSDNEKRAIRLQTVSQVGGGHSKSMNTQRSNSKARSLIALTNNANIFGQLHSEFCWLIKAASQKIVEKPMFDLKIFSETQASSNCEISSLRQLYNFLGKDKFRVAAFHSVIGHQIIVRSKSTSQLKTVIKSLSQLLPVGCVKAIYESSVYEDIWKCNFLGILDNVPIPNNGLDCEFQLRIDIAERSGGSYATLHAKTKMPDRLPKYVTDLERVVQDMSFSDSVLDAYLVSWKEEWLNKAKMIYSYTKGISSPRSQQQMSKLYQALNVQEYDIRLLQFWMSGLPISFKTNVVALNASIPQFEMQANVKNVNTGA